MESKVSRRLSETIADEVCEHIYGPRLKGDFQSAFPYMTDLNQAHVLMLKTVGLISLEAAREIAKGLIQMEDQGPEAVSLDPRREDAYFNYEAHLINIIGTESGGRLHIARSRNDLSTAIDRLKTRDLLLKVISLLIPAQEHALANALNYKNVVMTGYTHMQPAQPITYGFYLAAIAEMLERNAARFFDAWKRTNLNPLGAAAMAGTTFAFDRNFLTEILGFDGLIENTLDAVASRDFGLESLGAMTQLSVDMSRIAQDYYMMVSHEFQTIEFPDRVAGTSSIMPQKKNPVVLEHLRGKAAHIIGLYTSSATAMKGTNFTNTSDGSREGMRSVYEAGLQMEHCLPLFDLVISTARPNALLMERRVRENFASATDIADALVREGSLSFREAHHVVGAVVRAALDRGLAADQITPEMVASAAQTVAGKEIAIESDVLSACLNPLDSVSSRQLPGGPSPTSVASAVNNAAERLDKQQQNLDDKKASLAKSRDLLKREIRALAS